MPLIIEPEIQEIILDALPANSSRALEVIAQLTANMIISIKDANINNYIDLLKHHLSM